jgi:hypothetical protein
MDLAISRVQRESEMSDGVLSLRRTGCRKGIGLIVSVVLALMFTSPANGDDTNEKTESENPPWANFMEADFPFFSSVLDARELGRGPSVEARGRFKGMRLTERGVSLEYEVNGTRIREWVNSEIVNDHREVKRRFELERLRKPLWLALGQKASGATVQFHNALLTNPSAGKAPLTTTDVDGIAAVRIAASRKPVEFSVTSGPTWKELFGTQREFKGGEPAIADEAYLRESMLEPAVKVVSGFEKNDTQMPSYAGVLTEA